MTAEELLLKHRVFYNDEKTRRCRESMIEFAQYHVEQALIIASQEATITNDFGTGGNLYDCIDKDSILNAYLKENIK
jgi:hypothetical protein